PLSTASPLSRKPPFLSPRSQYLATNPAIPHYSFCVFSLPPVDSTCWGAFPREGRSSCCGGDVQGCGGVSGRDLQASGCEAGGRRQERGCCDLWRKSKSTAKRREKWLGAVRASSKTPLQPILMMIFFKLA
uniref:Uncharacterized protein n=1 Tax=Triticum urartu TaxID=4572 RepID=A0A8R7RGL6_TRIUA